MPELPEVETIRIGLSGFLPGKQVQSVCSDNARSFPNAPKDVDEFLIGAKITDVRRRAKVLLIDLDSVYTLVIHLKMTGQLVFVQGTAPKPQTVKSKTQNDPPSTNRHLLTTKTEVRFGAGHPSDSLIGKLPDKSTRAIIEFKDASKLFFNDQRKFGWARLMPTIEVPNIDFMKKVGPEPLEADFTQSIFRNRIRRRAKSSVKAVLLDQTVLAGVGNIYADESLWGAKIHPSTIVGTLSDQKLNKLYDALLAVLRLSIEKGGSTDKNYVNAEGKKGSYLSFANVFRREGQPCARCSTLLIKVRVAGRGTHLCPNCQKVATP